MKRVNKGPEPAALTRFREKVPAANWEQLRKSRKKIYRGIKQQCLEDQHSLCGYCEIALPPDPKAQRLEHFHPKRDQGPPNWALDWDNIFAVCLGGTDPRVLASGHFLEPLSVNRSCDSTKENFLSCVDVEGRLLNPLRLVIFPNLFKLDHTGAFVPHVQACDQVVITPNLCTSTRELVMETIKILNLNCERLKAQRRIVIEELELMKQQERKRVKPRAEALQTLARRFITPSQPFFTTWRILLRSHAEDVLKEGS